MKWFYEILENEEARLRKRQRSRESSFRAEVDDDLIPMHSPALRLERRRLRDANAAFQMDWGLGDQSAIMPLPLESEYLAWDGDAALDKVSDGPEQEDTSDADEDLIEGPVEDDADARSIARASEPHVIRLRPGQRLLRYVRPNSPQRTGHANTHSGDFHSA